MKKTNMEEKVYSPKIVEVPIEALIKKNNRIEKLERAATEKVELVKEQAQQIADLQAQNKQAKDYLKFLEGKYVDFLQTKRKELSKSMLANEKVFAFISEKDMVRYACKDNKRKKIEKLVKGQLAQYDSIIASVKSFKQIDGCPFGEELQLAIFETAYRLLDQAIAYGYCKQARELIRIAKNPRLVGKDLASANMDDKILKVVSAYGKRTILEGENSENEIKEEINNLIIGVKKGKYGDCKLSQDKIEEAYRGATVKIGDTILKMDGSHFVVDGKSKE